MAKDLSSTLWHGVPRREIPWFPKVDPEACIGCQLCWVTCGREVYEIRPGPPMKAEAAHPLNCMVGCTTCAMVCPSDAISFPGRDIVRKVEREHRILAEVRKEAATKREKADAASARAEAEKKIAEIPVRARASIAGGFGEKRFLMKLEELVKDRPFDVVDLKLEVPTVKGLMEATPAFMSFGVASTGGDDVRPFLAAVKDLAKANGLVWVDEVVG